MNSSDDYNVAARYRTIRKHLDSLGYRQAFSPDALPLVEKILADLIQTTDSLKHFKSLAQDNVEACSQLQVAIEPYKCDNARLVQECNQLHLELTEARETHQNQAKDLKKKIYGLECECDNLQLASSKNLKRIKELETESAQKSKRIQELLGKCCRPSISNACLAAKKRPCYPLRRPSLEAEPLPRTKKNASLPSLSKVEPRTVDLLAMADRKMNSLNHEVTTLKGELSVQLDNVSTLKTQLASKEKEIMRLRKMMEGGRPPTALAKDCSRKKSEKWNEYNGCEKGTDIRICHQGTEGNELIILQQTKLDLEQQLREALDKQHDAMTKAMKLAERNEELEKELRDIDHIALAVEADCNSTVKENNKRVSELQEKLANVLTQVHVLEGELMVERRSAQELRADMEAGRLENRNLQRKLESTLEEKKQMTDRINQLTVIEKSLNDEVQRLSKDNKKLKEETARLEAAKSQAKKQIVTGDTDKGVKFDTRRAKDKGEKNNKNRGKVLMKKKVSASRAQQHSPVPREKSVEAARAQGATKDHEVNRDSNIGPAMSQKYHSDKDIRISQLQSTIDQIQTDRDYYQTEYNRLREQCMKSSEADNAQLWGQVCELRRQLIEKENLVLELQREKKEISREMFEMELRLQSARSERRNSCHPCSQCRPINKCVCTGSSASAGGDTKSAVVERLERDRDSARAELERVIEERDCLRERLKLAVEAHKFEQHRLRQNLCEVEARVSKFERERQDIFLAQGSQRATISGYEDQLEDLKEELRRTKQELTSQRTQYFQLRTLQDQADQALGDVQGQLSHTEAELYKSMDRNRVLEQQRLQLDNDVKGLKQEINTIRANVSRVNQEKDQLMMQLEEKNERISMLERELKIKEQQTSSTDQQVQELQQKNQLCVDQRAEQERRLRNMQMEMELHQRQLAAASSDRDNAAQENRRLQDDLAALTCEIRTLQQELETSRAESYDLKRQLQTYVSEVRRAEELINRKENERTEMLNHFRSLSLEATMLENSNHSLESEAAEARGALQTARDRSLDLERQLTDKDCLIRGYEGQITELSQTVASLETQIRQQMEQRRRAEDDLNAVRDLCVKLDQQKEMLVKELGDKDAMKAQFEAQIARLKTEQNMVHDQINRDHVTVERLETLLDQARQESINSQTANQELQCEISRLKQRICELQTELSTESGDLRRYQNQAAEYSKQIGELRREVTNERFTRARKEEEHRSNCQCNESKKSNPRRENFSLDTPQLNVQQARRLDCNSLNVQCGSSPRYEKSGKVGEYRGRGDLIVEAKKTNRFDTPGDRPSRIDCNKCAGSDDKASNESKSNCVCEDFGNSEEKKSIQSVRNIDESKILEKSSRSILSPNCEGICVRASLAEDKDHRDIRVRISNSSQCAKSEAFDRNAKVAFVKFCTSDASEEMAKKNPPNCLGEEKNEAGKSKEKDKNVQPMEQPTEVEKIRDKNEENVSPENLDQSSKLSLVDRRSLDERMVNDTIGYTLRQLRNYLKDVADDVDPSRQRSRSFPCSENCDGPSNCSKMRFPVRINYSDAAITEADLTRPEFVAKLTELRDLASAFERRVSQRNREMRQARLKGESSKTGAIEENRRKKSLEGYSIPLENVTPTISGESLITESQRSPRKEKVSSEIDFPLGAGEIPSSSPKKTKKCRLASGGELNVRRAEDRKMLDGHRSNREKIFLKEDSAPTMDTKARIENRESSDNAGTQTSVNCDPNCPERISTVNESIMAYPSKIHKLNRNICRVDEGSSGFFAGVANLGSPRSNSREKNALFKGGGSRNVSVQSLDTRTDFGTTTDDSSITAPAGPPGDVGEVGLAIERGRRTSRSTLSRNGKSPSSPEKRKNSKELAAQKNDCNGGGSLVVNTSSLSTSGELKNRGPSEKTMKIDSSHRLPSPVGKFPVNNIQDPQTLRSLGKIRKFNLQSRGNSRDFNEIEDPEKIPKSPARSGPRRSTVKENFEKISPTRTGVLESPANNSNYATADADEKKNRSKIRQRSQSVPKESRNPSGKQ